MPLSSGFSIQRNELTRVPHRVHTEYHVTDGAPELHLKSMIDFSEKNWQWDIRVKSVKRYLNRESGNNFSSNTISSIITIQDEHNYWDSKETTDIYTEGDISDPSQVVEFDQTIGNYGGLRFGTDWVPSIGDTVSISYRESPYVWAGNGGLLHQLATDLCVHPYDVPEVRVIRASDFNSSNSNFEIELNELGYLDDVITDDISDSMNTPPVVGVSAQRRVKSHTSGVTFGLWRVVRNDTYTFHGKIADWTGDITMIQNTDEQLYPGSTNNCPSSTGLYSTASVCEYLSVVGVAPTSRTVYKAGADSHFGVPCFIPYTRSDLGNGEFVVSIDGRVVPKEFWYAKSTSSVITATGGGTPAERFTIFHFIGDFSRDIPWVIDPLDCVISISFNWKYSTLKPYGALVGPEGYGPEQERHNDDFSFNGVINAVDSSGNTQVDGGWTHTAPTITDRGKLEITNNKHFGQHDILLLEYLDDDGLGFNPAFKLIYPPTDSNEKSVIESSCDQISNIFVVESTGSVDLLSYESQGGLSQHLPGGLKSQKWRIRFEWLYDTNELKVNVATKYQLKDDGTITLGQSQDGIKQSVFRLPGELCDIYHEPVISRNISTTSVKNKSHWFKRTRSKSLTSVRDTYPISYKLTTTNHGVALFLWEQSSVDSDTDASWFVIQRHVDQTTGQPDITGKTPLHCVYSPSKRVESFEGLQQYYSSSDVKDLSPSPIIYDALGNALRNPSKTYWVSSDSVFDGNVNVIDFFGKGYGSTLSSGANPQYPVVEDLSIGVIPGSNMTGYANYWSDVSSLPNQISSLNLQGFKDLPRNVKNNNWAAGSQPDFFSPDLYENSLSYSGNLIFTTLTPERMSPYGDISGASGTCVDLTGSAVALPSTLHNNPNNEEGCIAEGRDIVGAANFKQGMDYTWIPPSIPSSLVGTDLSDWKSYADSLIDILSPHNINKKEEIKESMIVSLNEIFIERDEGAYILSYDEWCKDGDPATVSRFLASLDVNGVDTLGSKFKLPMFSNTDTLRSGITVGTSIFDLAGDFNASALSWADLVGDITDIGVCSIQGLNFQFGAAGTINECKNGASVYGLDLDPPQLVSGGKMTNGVFIQSTRNVNLQNKLPGDVVFLDMANHNNYFYDLENKTLFFKKSPQRGVKLSISFDSFSEMNNYLIKTVEDRDFISMEEDSYSSINRFVVRESDVLKPWDYHVSATKHSTDSYSIINPYEQLSITDDRNFVFSFPTQLTTQRFYYPTGELDMICISSAGFSSQGGHIEIDKYSDSTGITTDVYTEGNNSYNPTGVVTSPDYIYSGQIDPSYNKYYWKRNIRKYEGMTSTLPNGNGMRVFVLVTGTSVRHSDVEKRAII
jgi:hypothetical protein